MPSPALNEETLQTVTTPFETTNVALPVGNVGQRNAQPYRQHLFEVVSYVMVVALRHSVAGLCTTEVINHIFAM